MKSTKPGVLIVILNYGTYRMTLDLIGEIKQKLDYDNYAIMVVDNCSPNESAQILEGRKDELGYVFCANRTNAGYAAGNNIGIRYGIAHGFAYSWILNNDVEIRERNVLDHMVAIAESNERIGSVGPMIYTLDGTICPPYCRRPSMWSMTLGIRREKKYRQSQIHTAHTVYRVYGCCMLLKNKSMADIDCLDERTFLYGEEDILAERLTANGYATFYDADVSVTHKESASMKKMSKNQKKLQIRETRKSMELYLKEYRGFSAPARWSCESVRSLIIKVR